MIRWGEVWTDNCFTTCQCWLVNFSGDVSSSSFHSRSALWSWQEYTTSTLCFMELWPWVSVNSHSISRTVQLGLFCRHRGDQTPSHYSVSYTGCLSHSRSVTSWLCSHWQFTSLQCRRILESTHQNSSECVDSSLVVSDCTHWAVYQHSLCQVWFPLLHSSHLELFAKLRYWQGWFSCYL